MTRLSETMSALTPGRLITHLRTPLYRNAYALMVSAIMSSGLGMLYWFLAARFYATDVVGLNSATIAATMFLGGVAGLYLDGALIRFLPEADESSHLLIQVAYLVSAAAAILVSVVFLLGLNVWSPTLSFLTSSPWWSLAFLVTVVSTSLFTLQDGVLTGLRQSTWVAVKNTVTALVKVVLLIFFAYAWPDYGILAAWLIPGVLILPPIQTLITQRLMPQRRLHQRQAWPIQARMVARYAVGNYLAYLFYLAATMLLPLLVVSLAGVTAGAYFYLPWVISNALRLVTLGMSASLTVEGATDQRQLAAYGRVALRHTARLLIPLVIILVVGAPYVLQLFGQGYAAEGVDLLRWLVVGTLPNSIIVLYLGLARVRHHIWRIVAVQAMLAGLVLGLSWVGLAWYGIVGVGIASFISGVLVAGVLLLTELREVLWPSHS